MPWRCGMMLRLQFNNRVALSSCNRQVIRAISHSRVLDTVGNDQIIQFIKQHNGLSRKIKINDAETKIILDTKVSQNFFMKLLNDDYLKSELTNFEYDADSKDLVEAT